MGAVNIAGMGLLRGPMPAGARSAAQANNANGMTELMAAMPAMRSHSARLNRARAAHKSGSRMSAPRLKRASTSGRGPKSAAATRMNRNEPPQMAPSIVNSSGARQGAPTLSAAGALTAAAAAGVTPAGLAVVHSEADIEAPRRLRARAANQRSASSKSSSRSSVASIPTDRRSSASPMPRRRRSSRASPARSEEHTSELQSRLHLVCRLLLEKKHHAQLLQPGFHYNAHYPVSGARPF